MSWHIVGPVTKLHLEGIPKLVLMMFANECDDDANSATAVETVGLKSGLNERTVQRMTKWFTTLEILVERQSKPGRGHARRFWIDLKKAHEIFGENPTWAERQALKERGEDIRPFHRPPKKGDTQSPLLSTEKGDTQSPFPDRKGDTQSLKGDTQSPIPSIDPEKKDARAQETPCGAAAVGAAAPHDASEQGDQASSDQEQFGVSERDEISAYGYWKSRQREIEDYFGGTYGVWIKNLVPLKYDGKNIALGAVNEFTRAHICGEGPGQDKSHSYRQQLADLLGLEVYVIEYNLSNVALARRIKAQHEQDKAAEHS